MRFPDDIWNIFRTGRGSFAKASVVLVVSVLATFCARRSVGQPQLNEDNFGYAVNPREVSDLFFVDSSRGWIALQDHKTQASYLFRTSDGGQTWMKLAAPSGLFRVFFISPTAGWALVKRDENTVYLFRTLDGGVTWKQSTATPAVVQADYGPATMDRLAFADEQNGWLEGGPIGCPLMRTIDGGQTLISELDAVGDTCYGIYLSKRTGILVYGERFVTRSVDGGKNWEDIPYGPDGLDIGSDYFSIDSAFFLNDGHGWLAGTDYDNGIILATVDFGRHWKKILAASGMGWFHTVYFWDDHEGCTTADPIHLACTNDGGRTWKHRTTLPPIADDSGQSSDFTKLVMLSGGRGWVLRRGGFLYVTTDGGRTWRGLDLLAPGK